MQHYTAKMILLSLFHLSGPPSFIELYAYAGYKFVALCINMLVSHSISVLDLKPALLLQLEIYQIWSIIQPTLNNRTIPETVFSDHVFSCHRLELHWVGLPIL